MNNLEQVTVSQTHSNGSITYHKYVKIKPDDIFQELPKYISNLPFQIHTTTDHWTAGAYNHAHANYHILIANDYILVSTEIATRWHYHCLNRNANNLGLSFMAMAGAIPGNMGRFPITDQMYENIAKARAVLKKYLSLSWDKMVCHAFYARLDKYYPHRWDTEYKLDTGETVFERTQAKSKWYYEKYLKDS